jgi:uncharacterized protein YndB with AHSA1/START domain
VIAQAEIVVDAVPEQTFRLFTAEIGLWWRRHTPYWNDPERGLSIRIEPGVGGRFVEIYDLETGEGLEVGRVTTWEPGRRLGLTWTQIGWPEDVFTDIEVTFEPADAGTRVRISQTGFERVSPAAADVRAGYESGWREVIGWFAEHVSARRLPTRPKELG